MTGRAGWNPEEDGPRLETRWGTAHAARPAAAGTGAIEGRLAAGEEPSGSGADSGSVRIWVSIC